MKKNKSSKKKIRRLFLASLLHLKQFRIENSIILTSEPRSGSTWLMELLGSLPNTIVNWEPLQVNEGIVPKYYKLGWRPLIKSANNTNQLQKLFGNILTLQIFNAWTTRFISVKKIFSSKYVVTKFVRANSLLPWLTTCFKFRHKPILLLRHPITTCVSQLKNFHKQTGASISQPYVDHTIFVAPDCINNERYIKHQDYLNLLSTPLERQIGLWCVNNCEVVNHPDRKNWITVYYENLVLNIGEELSSLLKNLDLPFNLQDFENVDFQKPSHSNYLKEYNSNSIIQLESFLNDFDEDYLRKIQSIFDYFGFNNYNALSAYPIQKN